MNTSTDRHRERYAKETDFNGIEMRLIGHWVDLAAYYRGSDGNAWAWQSGWSNRGPCEQFIERVKAGKWRGVIH